MTEIGELVPIKNDFGDKLLSGDDEGAQVLGFWLWLFALWSLGFCFGASAFGLLL